MYDIQINDLNVYYDSVCALSNINLKIKNKEFLGMIGPNGGGKTTLLKIILGLLTPRSGKIQRRDHLTIGYVPQFMAFDRSFPMSVLDVVLMGRLSNKIKILHKYSRSDIQEADKIMTQLGIWQYKHRQIGQLSGGQLQKVLIARALVTNPQMIVLDEPTSSIDTKTKIEIYEMLKSINKEKTIIIVSHDTSDIFKYINSVAYIDKTLHYHVYDFDLHQKYLRSKQVNI